MKSYKNKWIITTGLISIGIMVMIFLFSNQIRTDSDVLSRHFAKIIMKVYVFVTKLFPVQNTSPIGNISGKYSLFDDINHYVRKAGHMFEYALLASSLTCHIGLKEAYKKDMNEEALRPLINRVTVIGAFIITVLYAASDEFHQLFVDGRGARVKDVFIDGIGGIIGIFCVFIICRVIQKRKTKKA